MVTKLYRVRPLFARENNIPAYFVATELFETKKAVFVYGRGTSETTKIGKCCVCGRTLTHPVSVELGIGPECGGHFWDWDKVGGYTEENIERLKGALRDIKVDCWIPKSIVIEELPTEEKVDAPPSDHPIVLRKLDENNRDKNIKRMEEKKGQIQPSEPQKVYKNPEPKSSKKAVMVRFQNTKELAIKVSFAFNREVLDQVKTLAGRRFHSETRDKYWSCPFCIDSVKKLKTWGFSLDNRLQEALDEEVEIEENIKEITEIKGLKKELFPFQLTGVNFIERNRGRALIGDEMGLGKTIQALAWLQLHPEIKPVIIVVPASLKLNWAREAHAWMSKPNIQVLSGTNPNIPIVGEIIIINYDILPYWIDILLAISPKALITDESHYYKSNKAQRTKAVKKLGKKIPHVLCLSGTPIVNKPIELFNCIHLINPTLFASPWAFAHRYCDAKNNGFGWDFNGASNTKELNEILTKSIMIRRKKEDVLTDLPDKTFGIVPMELDNYKEYFAAEDDFISFIRRNSQAAFDDDAEIVQAKLKAELGEFMEKYNIDEYDFGTHSLKVEEARRKFVSEKVSKASAAEVLTKIEVLKQLAVKGKLNQAIKWIEDFLESGEKLVVFGVHKFVINALMEKFGEVAVKIDGSVSQKDRQIAVDSFQGKKEVNRKREGTQVKIEFEDIPIREQPKLFVGNIKAAGVGLTLTAASNVVFLELPWTPGDLSQAEDRCHRIGQKDTVNIYYLLAADTIEEKIAALIDDKRKVLDAVLDGKDTEQSSLLSELLTKYR